MRYNYPVRERIRYVALLCMLLAAAVPAADLQDSLKVVSGTNREAAKSQQEIDKLARDAEQLLEEYRRLRNSAEYQSAYTLELQQLSAAQQEQIESLQQQIAQARITQQRIVPLMRSMADALERFVVLDIPFHHEERIAAVLQLKQRLRQPGLSIPARFRLLFEAYQLEQGYGSTIEAWRGVLDKGGDQLSVEYLRIGRVALYYQSLDGAVAGYWNAAERDWLTLDEQYHTGIAQALRVARNQVAPALLTLPMAPPGSAS